MPRVPLTPREEQERKERIASAATYLFARRGFDNVNMFHIADAAKISVWSLYRSFRDKKDILRFICKQGWEAFHGELAQPLKTAAGDDSLKRIEAMLACGSRFTQNHPDLAFLLAGETYLSLEQRVAQQGGMLKLREDIARLVGEARGSGACRTDLDPEAITNLVFGTLVGMFLRLEKAGIEAFAPALLTMLKTHSVSPEVVGIKL